MRIVRMATIGLCRAQYLSVEMQGTRSDAGHAEGGRKTTASVSLLLLPVMRLVGRNLRRESQNTPMHGIREIGVVASTKYCYNKYLSARRRHLRYTRQRKSTLLTLRNSAGSVSHVTLSNTGAMFHSGRSEASGGAAAM